MTQKIYKSAMGKTVDLGALILENENTRAVGNMNVNARGDVLNNNNKVIDSRNQQLKRRHKKQVSDFKDIEVSTGTVASRRKKQQSEEIIPYEETENVFETIEDPNEIIAQSEPEPVVEETTTPVPRGGLAAALAKSQAVKQELMKTPRQLAQEKAGVKKI